MSDGSRGQNTAARGSAARHEANLLAPRPEHVQDLEDARDELHPVPDDAVAVKQICVMILQQLLELFRRAQFARRHGSGCAQRVREREEGRVSETV